MFASIRQLLPQRDASPFSTAILSSQYPTVLLADRYSANSEPGGLYSDSDVDGSISGGYISPLGPPFFHGPLFLC